MIAQRELQHAVDDVVEEMQVALRKHGPFASAHEGYAILAEEVDGLWDLVKLRAEKRPPGEMYAEAKQVAAMALKFMLFAGKR